MKQLYAALTAAALCLSPALTATPSSADTITGNLNFSNGADDWFSEVEPGVGDTFDILFNPLDLLFVTERTGDFSPPLSGIVEGISASTGSFIFSGLSGSGFLYALSSDLVFAFDAGVTVTVSSGALFDGDFTSQDAVSFSLLAGQDVTVTGTGETGRSVLTALLGISDTAAAGGGTYNASIVVGEPAAAAVPLPATLPMIALALGGLAWLRRRTPGRRS